MAKVQVRLYLTGDSVPFEYLTEQLDVLPFSTRKKQNWPRPSILAGVAVDTWGYQTIKENTLSISTQLDKVEQIFAKKVETIRALLKRYSLRCNIVILVEAECGNLPEMVLSEENISFLAAIKAELGFDLYID